jgi:hypothetical protein
MCMCMSSSMCRRRGEIDCDRRTSVDASMDLLLLWSEADYLATQLKQINPTTP